MKFTLIMCTLGRTEEPKRLLDSLVLQTHKDFILIIVDQNTDGRLDKLIEQYSSSLPITHLHSPPGLSKARNTGLPFATEGIVAFPDDDCWYPPELLKQVNDRFSKEPVYQGLSINWAASETSKPAKTAEQELTKFTIWGKVPSICLFLRYSAVQENGNFDEELGVGAGTPWGAGEDSDYVLSSLERGHKWKRIPSITVFHADNIKNPVMVLQGANDPRVLQVESDEIVEAVKKNNPIKMFQKTISRQTASTFSHSGVK